MSHDNSLPPAFARPEEARHDLKPVMLRPKYFFVGMAVLSLVITTTGFGPSYTSMASGESHPPWFIHVHGALMLAWLFLFLVQTILAATRHLEFHRQLGLASVALGVAVWFSMGAISVRRIVTEHPPVEDVAFGMLAVDFYIMAIFGWFFTWSIWARKEAAVHKRFLWLAMIPVLHPAIGRIAWLPTLGITPPHAWYVHVDALLIPLFLYDWATEGGIHKITWIGSGSIVAAQLLALTAWSSPAWHRIWFGFFDALR